jgi:N-acetylglucosamine-6-phosphate deacetylase
VKLGVQAALVGGSLVPGQVEIVDGRIARYGLNDSNGQGRGIAVPGFVDLQVNGFAGVDFLEADAEGYRRAGEALLETGVTSFLPTLITAEEDAQLEALSEVPRAMSDGPRILGAHLEGPFLAADRLGTHPPAGRRDPDLALLERLLAAGPVRMMTLAPELPGALELIDVLTAQGIAVSCGHSDATAEQAGVAFDRGARTVTHLFNAMRPLTHRDPGIVGAALVRDDVVVQIIVDGIHLAPATTTLVWRAAAGRVALVTDAVAAASASGGSYSLGSVELSVQDGAVRAPEGMLAGSVLTMIEAVRNLHELGVPLEQALDAATAVPARVLGLADAGRLDVGLPADIVVLDDNLEIESVFVGGDARVLA